MLEVGKTYKHKTSTDKGNNFTIVEQCSDFFVGENNTGKRWLFDAFGNAIGCFDSTIKPKFAIAELPLEEVVYVRLNNWGDLSVSANPHLGTAVTDVKITFHDGLAVSAELHKPNEERTTQKKLLSYN